MVLATVAASVLIVVALVLAAARVVLRPVVAPAAARALVVAANMRRGVKVGKIGRELLRDEIGLAEDATARASLRDALVEANIIAGIEKNIFNPESKEILSNCAWLCSNLCRGRPEVKLEVVKKLTPVVFELFR